MMRLWTTSYARRERTSAAGVVSLAAHTLLIAAWVAGTLPVATLPSDALTNHLYYMPPPNKPPPARESRETVRYITLDDRSGRGPGPATIDPRKAFTEPVTSAAPGGERVDSVPPSPPSAPVPAA
jgi:hypothetical protein